VVEWWRGGRRREMDVLCEGLEAVCLWFWGQSQGQSQRARMLSVAFGTRHGNNLVGIFVQ
jgi:hypothetical protein